MVTGMGYYDKPHYENREQKRKRNSYAPVQYHRSADPPPVVQSNVQVEVKGVGFMSGMQFGFGCIFSGILFVIVVGFLCRMAIF